jgi:hypothetical protein
MDQVALTRGTFQNAFVSWLTLMVQMHQVSVGLMAFGGYGST